MLHASYFCTSQHTVPPPRTLSLASPSLPPPSDLTYHPLSFQLSTLNTHLPLTLAHKSFPGLPVEVEPLEHGQMSSLFVILLMSPSTPLSLIGCKLLEGSITHKFIITLSHDKPSVGYISTKLICGDQQRSKIQWSALPHERVKGRVLIDLET